MYVTVLIFKQSVKKIDTEERKNEKPYERQINIKSTYAPFKVKIFSFIIGKMIFPWKQICPSYSIKHGKMRKSLFGKINFTPTKHNLDENNDEAEVILKMMWWLMNDVNQRPSMIQLMTTVTIDECPAYSRLKERIVASEFPGDLRSKESLLGFIRVCLPLMHTIT